jgi:NAD+ synthase
MYNFDEKKVTKELLIWLRNWFEENGKGCNAILGISGGKDSTVAAALCVKALGKDRVYGVMMPDGEQKDISDSIRVCKILDIQNTTRNIKKAVDAEKEIALEGVKDFGKEELTNQTLINIPPRIRMATLYAIGQSMNGRVINTCNLSEEWVGYSTRWGDSVGDVAPLANLTVEEVRKVGLELGLPYDLVYKTPSDGLCGKTDEDSLGFTYAALDKYLRTGECDPEVQALIDRKHKINEFKLKEIPKFEYGKVLAKVR